MKREARLGQGLQEVGKRPAVGRPGAGALLEQGFPDPAAAFLVLEIEVADNAGVELCVGMVRHRSQRLVEGLEGVVVAAERPVHDAEVGPHVGVGGIEGEGPFVDRDRYNRMHLDELKQANQAEIDRTVALARDLLKCGWAYTLQVTMIIPYPGTPLFRECQEKHLLLTEKWEDYDMRTQIMKTEVPACEIRRAIRRIYRGFFHPRALWNRLRHTRHPIEDARFYFRGLLSLLGHLKDFGG